MGLPDSGVLLDIGANLGFYSFMFAKIGYNVISVEPMVMNRKALNASLCLNPELQSRIRVVARALVAPEDKDGWCVISSGLNYGNGALTCGKPEKAKPCTPGDPDPNANACEDVPVKTLDQLLVDLNVTSVNVVKMDVEGFECCVMKGGQSLFNKFRPSFVQAETKQSHVKKCFEKEAAKHKYRMGKHKDADGNRVIAALDIVNQSLSH